MAKNNTQVYFRCPRCSHREGPKNEYCPYTGMVHGSGWTYTCPQCNDPMEVDTVLAMDYSAAEARVMAWIEAQDDE
jgi:DNA-directed RNA polymerase subunit RPC12/RpoP